MDNVIFTRRSIRKFFDKDVEKEKIERILKAGMQAPSAHNRQPWEFIVVTDKEKREAVSKMSPYSGMVANAPVCIIVLGDVSDENTARFIQQDLGACTQNILLQIAAEGLGGCWMGYYPDLTREKTVRDYFDVPDNKIAFSVIALGYSPDKNYFADRSDMSKVHYEKY